MRMFRILTITSCALLFLAGCAVRQPQPADPLADMRTPDGTVVWQQEYEFVPPPEPWHLILMDEDDYSVAFYRSCTEKDPGTFPCESTMAYAEEPFGYSRDFEERQDEFFDRFLWAARVNFEDPELEKTTLFGRDALRAETVGHEPVLNQKVLVNVIFARRGERVVAFYFTQWRPKDRNFNRSLLTDFNGFAESFRFLKPSFYQQLTAD